MRYILPIISLILIFACSGKRPSHRTLELKKVMVYGKDSLYITVPDQTCSLKVETGKLCLFLKIKIAKKFALPFSSPPFFVVEPLTESGNPMYECSFMPAEEYHSDSTLLQFFNSEPGTEMVVKMESRTRSRNRIDLMQEIASVKIKSFEFFTAAKYVNKDSLIYDEGVIKDPDAFIKRVKSEIDKMEQAIEEAGNDPIAMMGALNLNMMTYQQLALGNRQVLGQQRMNEFMQLNGRYLGLLNKAKSAIQH